MFYNPWFCDYFGDPSPARRNTPVSSSYMEASREKPDASPDDIDHWVKNIETMRPDIMEGFAKNLVQ